VITPTRRLTRYFEELESEALSHPREESLPKHQSAVECSAVAPRSLRAAEVSLVLGLALAGALAVGLFLGLAGD
jgi:hypothetical protein